MITLRPVEGKDTESLYSISLATGANGEDAASLYEDGRMMGHIYSAPYAALSPSTCFVAEIGREVVGFAVGAIDTCSFEEQLEDEWWPRLRAIYADPQELPRSIWNADQKRCFMIHHPQKTPAEITKEYPSHLHLNLLPQAQGIGIGSSLSKSWLHKARTLGAIGAHVGVNAQNKRALRFWTARGFQNLDHLIEPGSTRTVWLGRHID